MDTGPQLEIGQIGFGPERIKTGEEARLMHDDAREHGLEVNRLGLGGLGGIIGGLPGVNPGIEIEVLQCGGQVVVIGGVIGLHRVARGHIVPMVGGDLSFHGKEVASHIKGGLTGGCGGRLIAFILVLRLWQFVIHVGVVFSCWSIAGIDKLRGDHVHIRFAYRSVVVFAVVGFVRQT